MQHGVNCDCLIDKRYVYKTFAPYTFSDTGSVVIGEETPEAEWDYSETIFLGSGGGGAVGNAMFADLSGSTPQGEFTGSPKQVYNITNTKTVGHLTASSFGTTNDSFSTHGSISLADFFKIAFEYDSGVADYVMNAYFDGEIIDTQPWDNLSPFGTEWDLGYWRLREQDGTMYYETSPDNSTWTTFTSVDISSFDNSINGRVELFMDLGGALADTYFANFELSVYDRLTYLGNLPNVISDLSFNQDINTAGSSTDIVLGISPDEINDYGFIQKNNFIEVYVYYGCSAIDETALLDCAEDPIEDQNGNDIFGSTSSGAPSGLIKFSGFISKVTRRYGDEQVVLSVLSHGDELDNYMLEYNSSDVTYVINQNTSDTEITPSTIHRQTFSFATDTLINGIDLYVRNPTGVSDNGFMQLQVTSPSLGTFTLNGRYDSSIAGYLTFMLPEDTIFVAGETNYFQPFAAANNTFRATGSPYANGIRQIYDPVEGVWNDNTATDFRFRMFTTTTSTKASFLSVSPSEIATEALNVYNNEGGIITAGEIEDSETVVTYTFQTNTILEVLQQTVNLSPYNWWWSVDLGTNKYNLKEISSTADHIFTFGEHIEAFELEDSIEDIINLVYFSGGETSPGVNLFITERDNDSINQWRRGLRRMTDSRVTLEGSARLLASGEIDTYSQPRYRSQLVINAGKYDTETIKIGQTVTFANLNDRNIIDLILQIQSISYTPDNVTIELDTIPRPVSKRVEDLRRNLLQEENQNNPGNAS